MMNKNISTVTVSLTLLFLGAFSAPASAQLLSGGDILLTDFSPSIAFDDDNSAGRNWVLRGDDVEFSLYDDEKDEFVLFISPSSETISLGHGASATGQGVALGSDASALGSRSIAVGWESSTTERWNVAVGVRTVASGVRSTAIGQEADALGASSVAVGNFAMAGDDSVALGRSASALTPSSVAIGEFAEATGENSLAMGQRAKASDSSSTALGSGAVAAARQGIALGVAAKSNGDFSTAVGNGATADGRDALALGSGSFTADSGGVALGFLASSSGDGSAALGRGSVTEGPRTTALGFHAFANQPDTMVLGSIPGVNDPNETNEFADVAIGTTTPLAPLHVFRDNDTREFLFLESDQPGGAQDRPMMQLINNGGIRFQFDNPGLGTAWRFQAATGNQDNFEVTKVGTGEIEFRVDADGNATLAGMLFENSDRNAKQNIEAISPGELLQKVAALPISEWEYKDTPGQRHVGPMAQDFHAAFGLGANNTSLATIDTSGVALASVQALNNQLQSVNKALEDKNRDLERRVTELEAVAQEMTTLKALLKTAIKTGGRVDAAQLVME